MLSDDPVPSFDSSIPDGPPGSPARVPAPGADAACSAGHRIWICRICGWIYDEALGLAEEGIAPGTRFEDIPDSWRCPLCGVGKEDFELTG